MIKKVGIELEGGWDSQPPSELHYDGSVSVSAPVVGEVSSPPLSSWQEVKQWVVANYPTHVNRTCGLHVHISVATVTDYVRLMDRQFYRFFLRLMREWGRKRLPQDHVFWDRLAGRNNYCLRRFCPTAQVRAKNKSPARYAHLNYCYSLHGTLEFRLLPMFDSAEIALSGIKAIIKIVSAWLARPYTEETIEVSLCEGDVAEQRTVESAEYRTAIDTTAIVETVVERIDAAEGITNITERVEDYSHYQLCDTVLIFQRRR